MHFTGLVYRAHDPGWSFLPLSGNGAAKYGGRFNPKGIPALYTSLTQLTAIAEYQQGFPHRPQPVTLCTYKIDCLDIIDISNPDEQNKYQITASDIACPWEYISHKNEIPPTWSMAETMIGNGVAGIIAPSFASNALSNERNLILWDWGSSLPHQVLLIDDEGRLPKGQSSWKI